MSENPSNDGKLPTDSTEENVIPFPNDHGDGRLSGEETCDHNTASEDASEMGYHYGVILWHWGENKIAVIKVIRGAIEGLSLADAKRLVESAPVIVAERKARAIAKKIGKLLEAAGATAMVTLRPSAIQSVHEGGGHSNNSEEVGDKGHLFNVILDRWGEDKIRVIREVFPNLGLADAKRLVEAAPVIVAERRPGAIATKIWGLLEDAGAAATIDPYPSAIQLAQSDHSSILETAFVEALIDRFEVFLGMVICRLKELVGNGDRCATNLPAMEAIPGDSGMKPVAHLLDNLEGMISSFDVILESYVCGVVPCARVIREHVPGLGISDAKALVYSAPSIVMETAPRDVAEDLKMELENVGAMVSIRGRFLPSEKIQIIETIKRLGDQTVTISLSDLKGFCQAVKDGTVDATEVFQLIQHKFLEGIEMKLKDLTQRLAGETSESA